VLARVRAAWWYGLGGLWIFDAVLQAQPSMFTDPGLLGNALLPAAQGQPDWIAGPMLWGAEVWERHLVAWNASAVVLELLIGCLLLAGPQRPSWGRAGLVLSMSWGLIVWLFGEGLGGLFTGSPTYLAGAPGSAFLYVLLTAVLLLPEVAWSSPRLLLAIRFGVGALWAVGALFQLAPLYSSPLGLASVLQNVAMMPLPFGLTTLDERLVAAMASSPALWNAIFCATMIGLAVSVAFWRGGEAPYILALVWLAFLWIVFQGFGMVFSSMATDPNTAPVWALLLLPGWFAARARPRPSPTQSLRRLSRWLRAAFACSTALRAWAFPGAASHRGIAPHPAHQMHKYDASCTDQHGVPAETGDEGRIATGCAPAPRSIDTRTSTFYEHGREAAAHPNGVEAWSRHYARATRMQTRGEDGGEGRQ
jgi:hypothetical protein